MTTLPGIQLFLPVYICWVSKQELFCIFLQSLELFCTALLDTLESSCKFPYYLFDHTHPSTQIETEFWVSVDGNRDYIWLVRTVFSYFCSSQTWAFKKRKEESCKSRFYLWPRKISSNPVSKHPHKQFHKYTHLWAVFHTLPHISFG